MEQQTLRRSFTLAGVGVHSGESCRVTVHPAEPDIGRLVRAQGVEFPARADYVVDTTRSTTLGYEGVTVRTVEHLLSALHGCGVDNARIEVTGPEIPILDGSALPFAQAILEAGIEAEGCPPRVRTVRESLALSDGTSQASADPASGLWLEVETEFAEWPEGHAVQRAAIGPETAQDYIAGIAPARTFAFRSEVEQLLAAGLAKGGSLDNALVITPPDQFSTPLRLPGEWCAHKLLDVIGDLALVDARLEMRISLTRPGHWINTRLAQRLREQSEERRG